jgi:tRNA(Arg) A34 adenosine deaminase TadA
MEASSSLSSSKLIPVNQDNDDNNNEQQQHLHYMTLALQVAKAALGVGEVPVGCVIVYHSPQGPTVVSHGANQVNATRDATRHAEIVALDRMLTGAASSDQLRLPPDTIFQTAHGGIPDDSPLSTEEGRRMIMQDKWVNEPDTPDHWKNGYGWGSGQTTFQLQDLTKCDLYVTCEPCIMVRLCIHWPVVGCCYMPIMEYTENKTTRIWFLLYSVQPHWLVSTLVEFFLDVGTIDLVDVVR